MHARRADRLGARVPCPHYPDCVGCPWVGTPYPEQLRAKHAALRLALERHPDLRGARLSEPVGSPSAFGYRNHAKLVFRGRHRPGRDAVLLGVYRPGTHSVMPAQGCIVHDRLLQPILAGLREQVEAMGVPIFDERRRSGELRYALARSSRHASSVHLTLVAAEERPRWLGELLRRLRRSSEGRLGAAFLCVNRTPGNVLLTDRVHRLFGPVGLVEEIGELLLESRPSAFVQANPAVAARIYATAARWARLAESDEVVDLYCGVGAIGLTVAGRSRPLLGIESAPAAVECARHNARQIGARGARFADAPVEEALELARAHGVRSGAVVIANPPRKGLSAAVIEVLDRLKPSRILYVSCDPTSLARDLVELRGRRFALERVQAFDMLPQTPHVEALALLSRRAR